MAGILESQDFSDLDASGLAEEMRLLANADYHELQSRLRMLIAHLLEWAYQSEKRSRSWLSTIATQRYEIETLLEQSPSLSTRLRPEDLEKIWRKAADFAAIETGLDAHTFPPQCIWDLQAEILTSGWLPPKAG
jgi:hypothetical protein